MTSPPNVSVPLRLDQSALSDVDLTQVLFDAAFAEPAWKVIDVQGPGAVRCLQGLLTNDLEQAGDDSVLYAAALTNRGMIVTDLWIVRSTEGHVRLFVPSSTHADALHLFRRSVPPRLAQLTAPSVVARILVGPEAGDRGLRLPEAGHIERVALGPAPLVIARPRMAPFASIIFSESDDSDIDGYLTAQSIPRVSTASLHAARVATGWPDISFEVDDKTLPQEVRFEEHRGVSFEKGCYVGQETVARVHFRGHPNRVLRGLVFDQQPTAQGTLEFDGRPRGRVTSVLRLPGEIWIGLGVLRREIEIGSRVMAGGVGAQVVDLPHVLPSQSTSGP